MSGGAVALARQTLPGPEMRIVLRCLEGDRPMSARIAGKTPTCRGRGRGGPAAVLSLLFLAALSSSGALLAQCSLPQQCTGDLTTGGCGFTDTPCTPPPSGSGVCSGNGVGQCSGTYNCVVPIVTPQGVQILGGAGGSFTARLPLDVVAPFNNWASTNNPNGTLQVFWYDSPSVPDICATGIAMSLCSLKNTDHGQFWLDETGLTCAGAPYDFVVSALAFSCQQPNCPVCEQQFGNPNCLCFASTSSPQSGLHIKVSKSMIPGCAPPPDFCGEGAGAGAGAGGPGGAGSGARMAAAGSKGNGPDSGAAGTTGNGNCSSCKSLGSSSGDGAGAGGASGYGISVGGGGASCLFKASGAHLRYGGGGVGGPGFAGSAGVTANPWNTVLGRNWSHDYAERIVMDPDETHVWLLTRFGSFREFGSLASGSGLRLYQTVTPSDEYRKLSFNSTTQGWQLQGLDGSVEYFLPKTAGSPAGMLAGFLDRITDRLYDPNNPAAHPPVQASYNASNQLDHVTFPDGRHENFVYAGGSSGKLASLTEVGTDGVASRSWTFTWNGDDLTTIGRPDLCPGLGVGTSWQLSYGDANHPGYLTQVRLTDCHNNGRIEAAFVYDASGNVVEAWRGDPFFTGPNATDAYQLSFDSPVLPAVATVQTLIRRPGGTGQDIVQTATYKLDHDPGRAGASGTRKVRVTQITGECPACGTANPSFIYGDPSNPLLPTTVTDGKGVATGFTYDANGRQLSRVETVQTTPSLVQRQTSWMYNATFPGFVASVTGPFSPPASTPPAGTRSTALSYDAQGNVQTSTASGSEATYPSGTFTLQTAYSGYSAAGLPGLINPPDVPSTTADASAYSFVSGVTDGYLVATRSDPVIGAPPLNATTSFQYDALNRTTDVTDVNGMRTHTTYDALNRVLTVTQGYLSAQSLTTTYSYNTLGDLVCVQLPSGNALAYGYDGAGRLVATARQASCAATQPLEQTLYTLDAAGHRIQEVRQRIVSGSPVTDATTTYTYTTTCHLDSMTAGDPNNPSLQSTTQFAYDCDNNLIAANDPNHPSPAAPSTSYSYDPLNRLTQVSQPWGGVGGGMAVTTYAYDLEDHLAAVSDSERNQTTYVSSDRDLLTKQTSPVTGVMTYAYNAHGALVQQTDARGVVTNRQLDPADRPTQMTYSSDPTLTTTYAYDTTTATGTSPVGRLSSITKGSGTNATVVPYTYDLFGRTLQDGALGYSYDANGNRASIAYPGSVTACYGYDVADRQAALSYSTATGANVCQGTITPIVTSTPAAPTVYSAAGPLQLLHLANGIAEAHSFDQRYFPTGINAGTLLAWTYSTDASGNITAISPGRNFTYQDFQYFLAQANAPALWGTRTWVYDTIGNRLSEDRGGGAKDTYTYQANVASPHGDTPLLNTITLANSAGIKYLAYDFAGNVLLEASPTSHLDFTPDAAGKLSRMTEEITHETSTLAYDGRGFLAKARNAVTDCGPLVTIPTYSSAGLLYQRQQQNLFSSVVTAQTRIFYFAGRPVAQLDGAPATGVLTYLTVDHLGTPILASTGAAIDTWSGGFEPFGRDFTTPSAQSSGIFLRLPGQWDDTVWDNTHLGSRLYYNVSRWYESGNGKYSQPDPLGGDGPAEPVPQRPTVDTELSSPFYSYVNANPTSYIDPIGLLRFRGCRPDQEQAIARAFKDYCSRIQSPGFMNCMCAQPSIPSGLTRECGQNVKAECKSDAGGNCQNNCGWSRSFFGRVIRICPLGWDPTRCGPLGCTLMHEMTHMIGNSSEQWPDQVEKCLGCK
jgi:RHS repeat-associated protein